MKKIISIGMLGLMSYAYADDAHKPMDLSDEMKYETFTKHGLPLPGTGVHLVPASSMSQSIILKMNKNSLSLLKKGYIEEDNTQAANLLQIKKLSALDLETNFNNHNPKSTHMRAAAKEVSAAYKYNGVPKEVVSQVIGFSPMGAFIDNKGWTGAVEFFEPNDLTDTTCSYSQSNIRLTQGSANIAQEIVSYDVNKKISIVEVIGNNKSGFGYNVEWYDDNYRHTLLCAQKIYSKQTIKKVIEVANIIDKSIS